MHRTGNHAICMPFIHHHRTKVRHIEHHVAGHPRGDTLTFPQLIKGIGVVLKVC